MSGFWNELKERNVVKVAVIYIVTGWLLIQVATAVFPEFDIPSWATRLVILVIALGFPIALIMAWALELTPEGIKRAESTAGEKRMWTIAGVLALLAIAWFEMAPMVEAPATSIEASTATVASTADPKSIAVLPFADFSPDRDFEWFTDGLTEEILNALARTPDLLVASRTSSFAFKNSEEPVADIANELNVAHVLEGSVRRAGDAIRVTVQLIRASDGFHLWSENIDGSADDIIDIQEKVASEIARSLETAMDPAELEKMMDVGTRSVRAYELYLQGIALQDEIIRTGDMRLIPELLEKMDAALEEDPGFSDVHAYQAFFWKGAASFNWKVGRDLPLTYKERQQRALESFENASRNARNAAERARYEYQITILRGNWREGLEILKAVEPERPQDFDMCADIAETHDWLGEREAAVAQVKRCLEIGKDNPSVDLGAMTDLAWQFGELAWVEELFAESPGNTTSDVVEAYQFQRLLLWVGDIEGAAQQLLLIENAAPDFSNLPKLRQACAESRLDDAERFYRQLINDRESNFAVGDRWLAHDLMGRPEQAYPEMHEYATAEKAATFADFLVYPQFDPTLFPELMKLIRRNNGTVIPPVPVPFACHARGEYPADLEGKAS